MKTQITILLLSISFALFSQKEIETTANIKHVTIYPSAAEITCEKELNLPKGKTTIVFTDLTPFIAENSINVSVNNPGATIITVSEHINYTKEKRNVNERILNYKDSIISMKKSLGLIGCKRETVETEKNLLFKGESIGGLSTHGVAVAEIEKASAFFSKRYYELAKELNSLTEREEELGEKISNYELQMKEAVTVVVKTISEIYVTVNCKTEEKAKFSFKFLTSKAGWAPLYDFKYEGPTKPIQFVFRANVFNASGITWPEVDMKLSTADPIHGFQLPSFGSKSKPAVQVNDVKFKQVEVVNAVTEYTISHEYTIPSDGKPYLIDVSSEVMPASFNYLLIPKLDPFGFLMAKIPNWNKYNLISGTTNIYNMGSYMGKTFLDTYSDNDTLNLYLGKDKNIQSVRNEKEINHSRFLMGNFYFDETHVDISIKNNSSDALPIQVLDQVPVYLKDDKEKLSVFNIGNALYDKSEGLLTWNILLKGNENTQLNFKYEIKAPKENHDGINVRRKKFRTISCPAF